MKRQRLKKKEMKPIQFREGTMVKGGINPDVTTPRPSIAPVGQSTQGKVVKMISMPEEDWYYFVSRIDIGKSFFDARAIQILNSPKHFEVIE